MFKRVILESWHDYVPYVCFALIAGAFLVILIRAVLMKSGDAERLASMPLLDDEDLSQARQTQSSDTARR
jgi:hypothetical protein